MRQNVVDNRGHACITLLSRTANIHVQPLSVQREYIRPRYPCRRYKIDKFENIQMLHSIEGTAEKLGTLPISGVG